MPCANSYYNETQPFVRYVFTSSMLIYKDLMQKAARLKTGCLVSGDGSITQYYIS